MSYEPWHHVIRTLEASWMDLGGIPHEPWRDLNRPWHRLLRTLERSARSRASSDTDLGMDWLNLGVNRDEPWRVPHQPRGTLHEPRPGLDKNVFRLSQPDFSGTRLPTETVGTLLSQDARPRDASATFLLLKLGKPWPVFETRPCSVPITSPRNKKTRSPSGRPREPPCRISSAI